MSCFQKGSSRKKEYAENRDKFLREFDERKLAPFDEKVEYSMKLIEKTITEFNKRCAVSCSFGKDSMAMVYMARKIDPDVRVIFANTGVEHKETLQFRDRMVEEWKLNYTEVKPIKTFWKCVDDYGYPTLRSAGKDRKGGTPKCCAYLKEKPLLRYYRNHYVRAIFLGITFDESWTRRQVMIHYGDAYYAESEKINKVHPIAYWTTKEVFKFHKKEGIPLNPVYDVVERCGCMPCTGHLGWKAQIAKKNPKLYARIQHSMGQNLISDYEEE